MDQDMDGLHAFLERAKASRNQRKLGEVSPFNPNPGYPRVNPKHESSLLLREIDDMDEDQILSIFYPQFKDDIVGIRIFPPIPGTRGFCFLVPNASTITGGTCG